MARTLPPALRVVLVLAPALLAGCQHPRTPAAMAPAPSDSVNVGYGKQAQREVTGAISSASGPELQQRNETRVEQMLVGRFAGVTVNQVPGGGISVTVRGVRSFNGSNEPLYVVDGMPISPQNGVLDINPRDVERIEVLKDAGATAMYGSRGANGVILITTKRGQ